MPIVEERKRILKMIEEGKLSAEEALPLLEQLENDSKTIERKGQSLLTELSTQVNWEEGQNNSKTKSAKKVKDSLLDFVDKAYKKIKDFDLDFNFGSSVSIQHIFQHSDVYLTDLDLDVANGSVKVVPWAEHDVRVECSAKVYQVESHDDARRAFLEDVLFSIEGGKLKYSVQKKKMKVDAIIFVPEAEYEAISIRLFNGKIDGEKLHVKKFKAKTANGKITVSGFQTDSFEVETANGHITAKNLISKKVEAETINGTIQLSGLYKSADLQSFNGNVICTVVNPDCETVFIKSTTGTVDLFIPKSQSIHGELKSSIGNIQCDLPSIEKKEQKSEMIQKYLKFRTNHGDETDLLVVDIETKTGSILVQEKGVS